MSFYNFVKKMFCFALITVIALFCTATVFAEGEDETLPQEPQTEYTEPQTEYTEPQTQAPETEPNKPTEEPATEYAPDVTEEPQTEPAAEAPAQKTEEPYYTEEPAQIETTAMQTPTIAKTVSSKPYSTNNTAGIVSWICVGVGVLAVAAVMISTKASGRKSARR